MIIMEDSLSTEEEYEAAKARLNELMNQDLSVETAKHLRALAIAVDAYEEKHHPMGALPPTREELCEDEENFESVHRDIDDGWRHGCYIWQVFHRKSDDTFWSALYFQSTDGEVNGLRDEDEGCVILRAYPHTTTTTVYRDKPQA